METRLFKAETAVAFVCILIAVFMGLYSADATTDSNFNSDGSRAVLTWSTTSPTVGDAVLKCGAKAGGGLAGVALNGSASATERVVMALEGIFNLPVTASSTVGNMLVGDYVYGSVGGLEVSTTVLSNINTGLQFGQLLDAITASTTHGVLNTVRVRINQPGHL